MKEEKSRIEFLPPYYKIEKGPKSPSLPVNSATMHDMLHAADVANNWAKSKEPPPPDIVKRQNKFFTWVLFMIIMSPIITYIEYLIIKRIFGF